MTLLVSAPLTVGEPSCYSRLTNEWICGQYLVDRQSELVDATTEHVVDAGHEPVGACVDAGAGKSRQSAGSALTAQRVRARALGTSISTTRRSMGSEGACTSASRAARER